MAKHRDYSSEVVPHAESTFEDYPREAEAPAAPAPSESGTLSDAERYPASGGRPPNPHDAVERPAGQENTSWPFGQYGTQRPVGPGKVPRVISGFERIVKGSGLARFKVRADTPGQPAATLYILAKEDDEDGARLCYAEAAGLLVKRRVFDVDGTIKQVVPPYNLVLTKLDD